MAALEDISLSLSLAEHIHEPMMISQLVRYAMVSIQFNATWEALQSDETTEVQLQQLQLAWEQLQLMPDADAAMAMERAMGLSELEYARKSYNHLQSVIMGSSGAAFGGGLNEFVELGKSIMQDPIDGLKAMGSRYPGYWLWCWSWTYDDERALIHYWQDYREELRSAEKASSFAKAIARFENQMWEFEGVKHEEMNQVHYLMTKQLTGAGFGFLKRLANIKAQRDMAIAAIALKRFHLQEKKYPAQLEELVPRFCKALPRDVFDGKPMRYALKPDGTFLLYSIGVDGLDNHGDATSAEKTSRPVWVKGRDLVWPRAATAGEAAAFIKKEIARAITADPTPTLLTTNQTTTANK
ncbi:MAG: hypothetical protein JWM68_2808 [Verrucomicrobiales bacterium]|nr:hypothetical protein [Verrucomicrobiales bacterium]